ncbi:MAG: DUF5691 domain-containing protein [Phycisphaerae bacterium]|nr:DUF5691 domain-containing protein [Phycisphaerae bacterium]
MTHSGPTQQWRQLVAAAVLGAGRAGGRLPPVESAPAKLLEAIPPDGAAHLLQAAAVMSIYERAGRRPMVTPGEVLRPSENDTTPACSFRSGQHLARILLGEFGFLLEEWCTLAAKRGVRVPDELLPALLHRLAADRDGAGSEGIAVLGRRGEWLAVQNPDWQSIVASRVDDPQAIWQTGEKAQRILLIRGLRTSDPRGARELIERTWATESGDDRADIVAALAIGLSPEDEPFLEAALDDGRKPVRQAAADLLARLPMSAFCKRMTDRATSLVTLSSQKRLLRSATLQLEVALPDKPDKALLRDGVENKRSGGMGERAHVLCQIVAATPLATWEACGAPPAEIIAKAAKSEWREPLLIGWARAAARQRSTPWAEPVLRARLASGDDIDPEEPRQLVQALDPAGRERVLTSMFRDTTIAHSRSLPLLDCCEHGWSPAFSHAALSAMRSYFGTSEAYAAHALRSSFKQRIARYLSPSVAVEIESGWNRTNANWHKGDEELVTALASTLAFRQAMQEELSR